MFEIRIHVRGGQGVVTAAELLSPAVFAKGRAHDPAQKPPPACGRCKRTELRSYRRTRSDWPHPLISSKSWMSHDPVVSALLWPTMVQDSELVSPFTCKGQRPIGRQRRPAPRPQSQSPGNRPGHDIAAFARTPVGRTLHEHDGRVVTPTSMRDKCKARRWAVDPGTPGRFTRTQCRPGYSIAEVDSFIDRVEATLCLRPRCGPPITAADVATVQFRVVRLRPG
jgi:DivIVA domain-containing protein